MYVLSVHDSWDNIHTSIAVSRSIDKLKAFVATEYKDANKWQDRPNGSTATLQRCVNRSYYDISKVKEIR